MTTQECPICATSLPPNAVYPNYVCGDCAGKVSDADGRMLRLGSPSNSAALAARYIDSGADYQGSEIYIGGIRCRAEQSQLGELFILAENSSSKSTTAVGNTTPAEMPEDNLNDIDEWEECDAEDDEPPSHSDAAQETSTDQNTEIARIKKKRKKVAKRADAVEFRLLGRRELCKKCCDIASAMQKIVKNRLLKDNPYKKSMDDDELTNLLKKEAQEGRFSSPEFVRNALNAPDDNFDRSQLKGIILSILLQEETYSCEERRLTEKVIEFETDLVKRAKSLDWDDLRKRDPDRWHQLDTYRIVVDAAWSQNGVSQDEARLLAVLRDHLTISLEEHWLISAVLQRFPKDKAAEHNPDEIDDARKQLQRDGLLWSFCDENDRKIDPIPAEIAIHVRQIFANQELQRVNFRRLLQHDGIMLANLKNVLQKHGLDRTGNKSELVERLVISNIKPSTVLADLDKDRLSSICGSFGLKAYGSRPDLIKSIIDFYDDLTFEPGQPPKDERELWYNDYELLASRAHAELRAKKLITKDIEIERKFENATEFLFSKRLNVACERANSENRADGRLPLDNNQTILWDCKSVEKEVNLQDHLDTQFDGYLRTERSHGKNPLAFLVIGPAFSKQSIILAHQYKAKTNWDIALVTAEGLKHLSERWSLTEPGKPFPIRLLNRTEVIDKERAEFLLSLA